MTSRSSDESGFTLIEILITITLLAVGVVVLISTFDYSRKLVTTSEASEVAAHRGQAEVERILALDYEAIALPSAPSPSSDPTHPNYYVNSSGAYQWDQGSTGPQSDQLVVDPSEAELTQSSPWNDGQGRLSGYIYRFVTPVAGTNGDAKRITVAVTVNNPSLKKPVLLSTIKTDPRAGQ